jgi:predicted transcriptional regulator
MAMTLRLTDEQTRRLRATAELERTSMQAVAIRAIDEYTTRRARRRDELLSQIVEEDAEVLRRLGDA